MPPEDSLEAANQKHDTDLHIDNPCLWEKGAGGRQDYLGQLSDGSSTSRRIET
jgi:hypothetical protein